MATTPKSFPTRTCLMILAVLVFFLGAWLFITRDIAPFDDSDLALPERKIDPEQNPFPMIRELQISDDRTENLKRVNLMVRDKEPMDEAFVDSVITDFAEELALFDRYAAMMDWKMDGEISISSPSPVIETVLKIEILKQAEIRRDLDRGEFSNAIHKTILLMKLGVKMQNSDGTLIHNIGGGAVVGIAHRLILEMTDHEDLNYELVELLANEINRIQITSDGLANAFRTEYKIIIPVVEDVANGKIDIGHIVNDGSYRPANPRRPNFFVFKENRTKLLYAQSYRDLIREVPMIRKEASNNATKRSKEMMESKVKMWLSGNAVGQILASMSIGVYEGIIDKDARLRAYHELIRLRIATERYRLSKGTWPPDLESLVPEFIASIPIDPMDGAPLRYNREALKIYSVGLDFIDDNGEADHPGLLKGRNELVIELEPD